MSAITDLRARQQALRARCVHPSQTFVEFPKEAIEQSIPDRFEQQVCRYPDRLAVKAGSHALTYAALNAAANRVAHAILARRGERPEPVALLFSHDAPVIAAILGVLKAGKICVPLDPAYPFARTALMREDSQAQLLVTEKKQLPLAQKLTQDACSLLDFDAIPATVSCEDPGLAIAPDAFSFIFYTSGSTGQPKGVVDNHRNVLHYTRSRTNLFGFCPEDRLTLTTSYCFGACTNAIFSALLNGAALFPLDFKQVGVAGFSDWLIREGITVLIGAMASSEWLRTLTGRESFPRLRLISRGGAPLSRCDVELYRQYTSPECLLVTGLGATEARVIRHYLIDKDTPLSGGIMPVGYAAEDVEVLLLDEAGHEVGAGEIGEIAVKSRYMAVGYWRQPELTRAAFRPDPAGGEERIYLTGDLGRMLPDGCLLHLKRKDFQVKIRGNRVEISEVERALLDLAHFREVAVVARADERGDPQLVAYLVPAHDRALTVSALRRALTATLPEPMIPSAFVMLDAFPRTPNGKINRQALPPPGRARPDLETGFVAPRTAVEELLAGLWESLLALDTVGVHDSFLELGGHSLLAAQMLSRVQEAFHCEVPLRAFFDAPTVAGLAGTLAASEPEPSWAELIARVRQRIDQMSTAEVQAALQQRQEERGTAS